MIRNFDRFPVLAILFLSIACSKQPTAPSSTQASQAGGSATTGQATLGLSIDPATITFGAAMMRNGATMHPVNFTLVVTETAGVAGTIGGIYCELRDENGQKTSSLDMSTWMSHMPGNGAWKMMDQTMYVGDPHAFGRGSLMVRMHVTDAHGHQHDLTATAPVQ